MPITSYDLEYFNSTNYLGGPLTGNALISNVLNGLFDEVDSVGSSQGETNYRCIYIKNSHSSITLQNAKAYMAALTPSSKTALSIGVGTSIAGGIEQSIPNETTSPVGIYFNVAAGVENVIDLGAIPPNSWKAIWLRRIVDPGAGAAAEDGATIVVLGDTTS